MTSTLENSTNKSKTGKTVTLKNISASELEKLSRDGMLSLTLTEMQAIQAYFVKQNREPTDVELETIAQTWSEHCVHKTFKARFHYTEENVGETTSLFNGDKQFENLLKETIVKTTEQLAQPFCLSVFKDNAGVIEFDEEDGISFKVETHNHPSALEPYGGAGTGVGGVIRDVLGCGLGGKPVMNTDVFCFGDLETPQSELPKGALSPKRIARGVISGVRDYGNRMGIPTANGAIYFDPGYVGNPLVFCGTVGIMPKNMIEKTVEPGDLVVALGGRTGRDGIHGATFSSAPLESGITSSVVQVGHAIMEKKAMDVLLAARNKRLYRSVTDCGAGGFSSAVGELGQNTGVHVTLEKAPLKYPGLAPWEIWVSESQERMVLAVPPENWNNLNSLCQQENVEAVVIGTFTNDKKLKLSYDGTPVAEIDMDFLHDGVPKLNLKATWNPKTHTEKFIGVGAQHVAPNREVSGSWAQHAAPLQNDICNTLKTLLQHPIIASKESVVRQYDHEVQGGAIIKPFMGKEHDGPSDASVYRPKLSSWKGFVVSNGLNPEVGKWDPYIMAKMAVDEAYRNLISVGGELVHAAILDNFCWGDAKNQTDLGGLVRAAAGAQEAALAYELPFISGKDSFNNTWKSSDGTLQSIPPTLLVSAIGVIEDVRDCLSSGFKSDNNLIYLVGETRTEMKGSLASKIWQQKDGQLPDVNLLEAKILYKKLQTAMKHGEVLSCHDISEGGLAVTVAEMGFGGLIGLELQIPQDVKSKAQWLFSETPSRFVVEISPQKKEEFEQTLGARSVTLIGKTVKGSNFTLLQNETRLFQEPLAKLKTLWKKTLSHL